MDPEMEARIAMGLQGISLSAIGSTLTVISGRATPNQLRELSYFVRDIADDLSRLSATICGNVADEIIEKSKGFKS